MQRKQLRTVEAQRIAELVDALPPAGRATLLDIVLCVLAIPQPSADPLDAESLPGNVIPLRSQERLP